MKSPYIAELEPNRVATATFLVHAKEIRQKKTGEPYLSLVLGDRTGELDAKMWDNVSEVMDTFERDDFVRVRGLLQIYNNRPQLTVHKMQKVDEAAVDLADYFPASERKPEEMEAELREVVASMANPHLRALLQLFLADEAIMRQYSRAPAAKFIHHAYLGGLIEHVLSVCGLCKLAATHYKNIDLDLLITGAVLHDIGKIHELTYDRSFGYTSEGQLLGHIMIGLRMVEEKLALVPDFPPRLRTLVEHMVLSHHGSLEFGSPKVPLFPEALLLHYLDDLDSKMECMRALVDHDRQTDGHWTGYSSSLERVVLKKIKYLSDGGEPACDSPAENASAAAAAEPAVRTGGSAGPQAQLPSPMPARNPEPPAPASKPRPVQPATASLFGEKLVQALREDK